MDFNLTREQTLIQKMVRAFTENEVKPIAAETDKTCEYPRENIEKLFHYGIMGMCVPKEYGGACLLYTSWSIQPCSSADRD